MGVAVSHGVNDLALAEQPVPELDVVSVGDIPAVEKLIAPVHDLHVKRISQLVKQVNPLGRIVLTMEPPGGMGHESQGLAGCPGSVEIFQEITAGLKGLLGSDDAQMVGARSGFLAPPDSREFAAIVLLIGGGVVGYEDEIQAGNVGGFLSLGYGELAVLVVGVYMAIAPIEP